MIFASSKSKFFIFSVYHFSYFILDLSISLFFFIEYEYSYFKYITIISFFFVFYYNQKDYNHIIKISKIYQNDRKIANFL